MATNHQSLGFSNDACGGAVGRASSVAGAGSSACDDRKSPVASREINETNAGFFSLKKS
jgi:hypothetical protein